MTKNEKRLVLYLLSVLIAGLLFMSLNRYRFYSNYVNIGLAEKREERRQTAVPGVASAGLEGKTDVTGAPIRSDTGKRETIRAAETAGEIDINSADLASLMSLPGIGRVTGLAIIEYRTANGKFSNVDELIKVKGIGEKKLGAIRGRVTAE
jgi:competence ComEA-like helix-hairpin-helix protein